MKRSVFSFHFSETTMFLIATLASSTVLIPFLTKNQIAIAQQQQKVQRLQNNQMSSPK